MGLIAAIKLFFAALSGKEFITRAEADRATGQAVALATTQAAEDAIRKMPKPEPQPDRFNEGAVYALLLLQREGRLVDFIQEGIDGYADADIGRAVRQIHAGCRKVFSEQFCIKPVMEMNEGDNVSIPTNFNPLQLRLTGAVPDTGPYKGRLAHKGWRAAACKFAERTGKVDPSIIQAAEIEVG